MLVKQDGVCASVFVIPQLCVLVAVCVSVGGIVILRPFLQGNMPWPPRPRFRRVPVPAVGSSSARLRQTGSISVTRCSRVSLFHPLCDVKERRPLVASLSPSESSLGSSSSAGSMSMSDAASTCVAMRGGVCVRRN